MANRLARETSPYLLQHSENPVDWYPWGEEALERARAEDRPILLSVGYSACHWCHVMEHESFSDPEIARLMNELFINIKVDREERPDVDALYMQAVQQMTGHGGWPMTVFLTPDGLPFYGGTYFPPEPRPGLPSFRQVLLAVHDAYVSRRGEVEKSAAELRSILSQGMAVNPPPASIDETLLQRAFHTVANRFDQRFGGFGGAPKFPQPMLLDFLLRYWRRTGAAEALAMVERTLEAMRRGGIYDQIGGGFHRYSVDARWLVPHFEKMLYDNALLARLYARVHQATGRPEFRATAEETLDYVLREMRHPAGGFFSSQDADSEGEEGRFYVWSAAEIDDALGEDAALFRAYFGVSEGGNWEGRNILHAPRTLEEVSREVGASVDEVRDRLNRARRTLYQVRSERVWPGRDEKILTSWNAMMLHAFAEAGRIFAADDYVAAAVACADFLLAELRIDGELHRTWRDGTARIRGFLEDHALLVDALVELYQTTFDLRWVAEAREIADRMIQAFWSPREEMFYDTRADEDELIVRPRDIYDNATPSGTSAAAHALTRLARLTGESSYDRIAGRIVEGLGDVASRIPQGFGNLLCALSVRLAPPTEIAIVGDPAVQETRALLDTVRRHFLPETTLALRKPDWTDESVATVPLLTGREMVEGRPTAYVCRYYSCRLPVTTPAELEGEIASILPSRDK